MRLAATTTRIPLLATLFPGPPFAWTMRDGLGPQATASTGLEALRRLVTTFRIGPATAALVLEALPPRAQGGEDGRRSRGGDGALS